MKKIISLALTFLLFISSTSKSLALYDPRSLENNQFGIHILDVPELDSAAKLVNENGGKWGYVTIPIQASDRDKEKWTLFMNKSKDLQLIPILRITTIPLGGTWSAGELTDLVDFANFLNELPWPIENRYIIIFNEVNRSQEWGGKVDPEKYADILKNSSIIFKERNSNFFILPAGLDLALPDSDDSLNAFSYFKRMQSHIPNIWNYIDGWNSHSYPNPDFSSSPYKTGATSIQGYLNELYANKLSDIPIFITETGWSSHKLSEYTIAQYYISAFNLWGLNNDIVAVTPFTLDARSGPFINFSFIDEDGNIKDRYKTIQQLPKKEGNPKLSGTQQPPKYVSTITSIPSPNYRKSFFTVLENFIRSILNLPRVEIIEVGDRTFEVEVAKSSSQITKGLSGHDPLTNNEGMLFLLPRVEIPKFWMKDMLFDLDIIWIKENTIVDISKNVPKPSGTDLPTYSPKEEADSVLEINAGLSDEYGLKIGDKIRIIE